ncbi:hypothetical protein [Parvularcula lutaonensis]|uniref:Uncharacterized protein n=1 Tax=Parvularcula lutaonensis TaxID=491923 RepID=A0ABV7M9C6_9PROT|nr:hypothetical protein [Parvularcula lutaonensis]GGY46954.1 hypothetical protein GCM10007148_15200 [Parvularcula lutaonensis]
MTSFRVAHLHEQGNDMIIVPLGEEFGDKSLIEQEQTMGVLRNAAKSSGLRGVVIPIWPEAEKLRFLAPKVWHPYFKRMTWDWLRANLNTEIEF